MVEDKDTVVLGVHSRRLQDADVTASTTFAQDTGGSAPSQDQQLSGAGTARAPLTMMAMAVGAAAMFWL